MESERIKVIATPAKDTRRPDTRPIVKMSNDRLVDRAYVASMFMLTIHQLKRNEARLGLEPAKVFINRRIVRYHLPTLIAIIDNMDNVLPHSQPLPGTSARMSTDAPEPSPVKD